MKSFKKFLTKRNLILLCIIFIVLGYLVYGRIFKNNSDEYILEKVQRGNLQVTVAGSGYIEPVEELNLKNKVSGEVVYIGAKEGDFVSAGKIIAKLDTKNIEKAISDQEINIKNLELSLELAKNNLAKFDQVYEQTLRGDDYQKALIQGREVLNSLYVFYPNFIEKLEKVYFQKDLDPNYNNLQYYEGYNKDFYGKSQILEKKYNQLKTKFISLSDRFKILNLNLENNQTLEDLIKDSYDLVKESYEIVNEGREMIRYLKEKITLDESIHTKEDIINNHWEILNDYLNNLVQYKNNLFTLISQINNYHDLVNNYSFERKNLELAVRQKETDLESAYKKLNDLKEDLKDYFIYAPLSGILTELKIKKGDFITANSLIGVLSTNQKIAKIDFNEIDSAKIKIGDIAYLTFDAIPDLKIYGKVIEISPKAKIDQDVVSYEVKISIDKEDKRIKEGMSVNAEVVVDKKNNVLKVSNASIKSDDKGKYVEVVKINRFTRRIKNLSPDLIEKRYIKTGLSDNTFTEVIEGLQEGEIVVVRKITNEKNKQEVKSNPFLPRIRLGNQKR